MALTRITRGMIANGAVNVPSNLYTPTTTATTSTFLAGNGTWRIVDELNTTTAYTVKDLSVTGNLTMGSLGGGGLTISSTATFGGITTFNSTTVFNGTTTFNSPSAFTAITVNTLTSNLIVAANVTATTVKANTIVLADGSSFTSTNNLQVTWYNVLHKDDNQGPDRVTLGLEAGKNPDPTDPDEPAVVALGNFAGRRLQQVGAVAIGKEAGTDGQRALSVAIGLNAGRYNQGKDPNSLDRGTGMAIAIGASAGSVNQERWSVALGREAGYQNQQEKSIAIGFQAGYSSLGTSTIAIGFKANGIRANQIVLNASGDNLGGANANALYVKPIRSDNNTTTNILCYDNGTHEVVYATRSSVLGSIDYGAI